jgi:hypothetical protein
MSNLAQLEEDAGNDARAVELWEKVKVIAADPTGPELHLRDLRSKMSGKTGE